jgi:hypothetical protein
VARVRNSKAIASPRDTPSRPTLARRRPRTFRHAKQPKARQYGRARRSQARTGDTTGRERKKPPGKLLHRRPPNPESAEDHPHSHASRRDPKSPARPTVRMPPPPGVNPIAARSTPPVRPARSQERAERSNPSSPRRLSALPLKTILFHATQVGPQSQLRCFPTPARCRSLSCKRLNSSLGYRECMFRWADLIKSIASFSHRRLAFFLFTGML